MESVFDKKTKINLVSFILASITAFAYGLNSAVATVPVGIMNMKIYSSAFFRFLIDLIFSVQEPTWFTLLFCVSVAYFYKERLFTKKTVREKLSLIAVSVIVVFVLILCSSFNKTNSWDLVFGGKIVLAKTLIKLVGFVPAVYIIIDFLISINISFTQEKTVKIKPFKSVVITALIILVCWSPYFFLLRPGCMGWDAFDQLAQALNKPEYSWSDDTIVLLDENVIVNNHHPILYTGILKLVTVFGQIIGDYKIAFEGLCILQSLCLALAFSYMIYVMRKHKAKDKVWVSVFIFCAFNPLFPVFGMTIIKDTLFCAVFVLLAVQLYEILSLKKTGASRTIIFVITLVSLLFARNNSVYILLLVGVCAAFSFWKQKGKMLKITALLILPVLLFQVCFINIICPHFKITSGSPREMLSVPFQQTVRYIKEHRDEITPKEEAIVSKVLICNGIDELVKDYVPDHADKIKNKFNKNADTNDLIDYFKFWLKGLTKHPLTYVEAYLNLQYGWFSFEGNNTTNYITVERLKVDEVLDGYDDHYGNYENKFFTSRLIILENKIPLTAFLFEMSTYTWLYLLLLFYIIKRKNKSGFIVCSLAFFNYLISFVGPVAYMRYALPMVCLAPFAIFIVFKKKKEIENNG